MKILHIARQFHPCIGGVENFVLNLAKEQKSAGHDVAVLTLDRSFADRTALPPAGTVSGIPVTRIPYIGSRRYPLAFSCAGHLGECDILHIHCVDFFVDYLVLLKPWHRKRIVLHTHGGYFHTPWMAGLKRAYFKTVTRLVLKGCYRVIACSENDREMFGRISPNVVRVDNGVDVRRFSAIAKDIEPGRLLYVGRLDEHKGLEDLVRTVGAVGRIGARVRLVVAGPDYSGLAPSLKRLASDLGLDNILFLGALRDEAVAGELAKSHIFVSASRYEAFGISAVEAMASGTLCVLNDIPAFRYISSGGETPYITDFSDAEKSARVIVDALSMDRERYGMLASRAREASARYDWRAVAARITELYR